MKKEVFIPKMSRYSIREERKSSPIKRTARFAPQLLADGLTSGIVSDQGNLVHGAFDEDGATEVDAFVNIASDKFDLMQRGLTSPQVSPSDSAGDCDGGSE